MKPIFSRRIWLASMACAAALTACGGADKGVPEAAFTMQLLHISDADGSDSTALNSVANLSGMVQKFRAQYPQQTLTVSSGDNCIPGPRFNASNDASLSATLGRPEVGRADMAFLNVLGIQASAIGNHELDLGTKQFGDIIKSDREWSGARFPYLAYNVDFAADTDLASLKVANGGLATEQSGKLTGWTQVQVGAEKVGVIGASSPVFANITTTGGLQFKPVLTSTEVDVAALAAEIQRGVDEMTAAGINKVVLLAHMQTLATEKALAARLKNVDIIVAGGSNTLLSDANDVLRTSDQSDANLWYAQLRDPTVQISLKNGGGIRSEIGEVVALPGATSGAVLTPPKANLQANRQAGQVSQLAIETALKFNNKLWTFDVTAQQLKTLLEHGVAVLGSQGRFPQVGGMRFSYDPAQTAQTLDGNFAVVSAGQRIRSLKVGNDVVVQNGVLLGDAQRTFRMVTLNFLAEGTNAAAGGGDSYPFPATADFVNLVKLDAVMTTATAGGAASTSSAVLGSEQDAFMKYMKNQFGSTAFGLQDTAAAQDTRIQNLAQRADTVLN